MSNAESTAAGFGAVASASRAVRTIVILILAVVILVSIGGYAAYKSRPAIPRVPDAIAEKVLFPIYMPTSLPPGYRISPVSYQNSQDVLLFVATDEVGHKIVFSEQAKPPDFDIPAFYQKSLNDPRSIPRSSYPSIVGKSDNTNWLLSVQADTTWIIITTKAPNPEKNLGYIAQHLQRQQ